MTLYGGTASAQALELENKRLRDALGFAERGWRDALQFATSVQVPKQGRPEDFLEIKSLQHEINVLQRQILKRAQMADEFQRALTISSDELERITNQLMLLLHAEVPVGKTNYAPPLWTVDFPSDSEVSSSTQVTRLGRQLRRLEAVSEWVKEHNMERMPHYEALLAGTLSPQALPVDDKQDEKKKKKAKKKTALGHEEGSVRSASVKPPPPPVPAASKRSTATSSKR